MFCWLDINDCASNPCENKGTCKDLINNFQCICANGFSGFTCSKNIDDCPRSMCLNGGKCVDAIASYKCECPEGYAGLHCEIGLLILYFISYIPKYKIFRY